MPDNNNLQELFDSFGSGLREYIQSEVKRQVTQTMASIDVEEEEAAVVGSDDVSMAPDPVVSSLPVADDPLAETPPMLTTDKTEKKEEKSVYSPGASGLKILLNRVRGVN